MKKLTFIAITILGMALASYAGNGFIPQQNANNDGVAVEQVKPHTKEYQDIKKLIDEYEQAVKKATSCEELDDASIAFFVGILGLVDVEYAEDEQVTEEEDKELSDQLDLISAKADNLKKEWNCPTDEEEETEEAVEQVETSTEEWEEIINEYDAIVTELEKMKGLNFDDEANLDKLLEVVTPLEDLSNRIDRSSVDNLTTQQTSRLEDINNRLVKIATDLGLMDEDEE